MSFEIAFHSAPYLMLLWIQRLNLKRGENTSNASLHPIVGFINTSQISLQQLYYLLFFQYYHLQGLKTKNDLFWTKADTLVLVTTMLLWTYLLLVISKTYKNVFDRVIMVVCWSAIIIIHFKLGNI